MPAFGNLADILLRTECAFGGKADIALSCRYVCNMAQRHFILTFTMRTDAAATSRTGRIRERPASGVPFGRFGWLLARMQGVPLFKLQGTKG